MIVFFFVEFAAFFVLFLFVLFVFFLDIFGCVVAVVCFCLFVVFCVCVCVRVCVCVCFMRFLFCFVLRISKELLSHVCGIFRAASPLFGQASEEAGGDNKKQTVQNQS